MKGLEKRLDIIYKEIEKILSLHGDFEKTINKLKAENQELVNKMQGFEAQLKKAREAGERANLENQEHKQLNNKEINNKIDGLLIEVERCITLLKK